MKLIKLLFIIFFLLRQLKWTPLSFGVDQTIINLKKVVWKPLIVDGLAPGAEIAMLRGSLEVGQSESFLRCHLIILSHFIIIRVTNFTFGLKALLH